MGEEGGENTFSFNNASLTGFAGRAAKGGGGIVVSGIFALLSSLLFPESARPHSQSPSLSSTLSPSGKVN